MHLQAICRDNLATINNLGLLLQVFNSYVCMVYVWEVVRTVPAPPSIVVK